MSQRVLIKCVVFICNFFAACAPSPALEPEHVSEIARGAFENWARDEEFVISFEYSVECKHKEQQSEWVCFLYPLPEYNLAAGIHWTIYVNENDLSTRIYPGV